MSEPGAKNYRKWYGEIISEPPKKDKMEEELAQRFYEKLTNKESNPGVILTQLYCVFYEFEFNSKLIPQFARLVKIYGRNLVFMALLDLFNVDNVDHAHIMGFITFLVKKRFEEKNLITETEDLSAKFSELLVEIRKAKKLKTANMKDPFDD